LHDGLAGHARNTAIRKGLGPAERHSDCNTWDERYAPASFLSTGPPRISLVTITMTRNETFWMACDSTEQLRAEYGPFHTRGEAEAEARKLGFGYLLRYEHVIDSNDDIQEVRCIFLELPTPIDRMRETRRLHTRCATCGEMAVHDEAFRAEVWADIHEFEHTRHRVRLFEQTRSEGLKEIGNWRDQCA